MILREQLLPFLDPDTGLASAAVDWLQEHDVPLCDLLKAYAGDPPTWLGATWQEDEALRELLALWCQWTEPEQALPNDWLIVLGPLRQCRFRFEAVRACVLDYVAVAEEVRRSGFPGRGVSPHEIEQILRPGAEPYPYVRAAIDRARRQQKRHVLTLFPEVIHPVTEAFEEVDVRVPGYGRTYLGQDAQATGLKILRVTHGEARCRTRQGGRAFRRAPFVVCAAAPFWVIEQALAAPDWIAPEPETLAGYPVQVVSAAEWGRLQSTPLEDLRRLRDRIEREMAERFSIPRHFLHVQGY